MLIVCLSCVLYSQANIEAFAHLNSWDLTATLMSKRLLLLNVF